LVTLRRARCPAQLKEFKDKVRLIQKLANGEEVIYVPQMPVHDKWHAQAADAVTLKLRWAPKKKVPVYIAGYSPRVLQFAGEIADGVFLQIAELSTIEWAMNHIRRGAEKSGEESERHPGSMLHGNRGLGGPPSGVRRGAGLSCNSRPRIASAWVSLSASQPVYEVPVRPRNRLEVSTNVLSAGTVRHMVRNETRTSQRRPIASAQPWLPVYCWVRPLLTCPKGTDDIQATICGYNLVFDAWA
jgi:hypothetical protein